MNRSIFSIMLTAVFAASGASSLSYAQEESDSRLDAIVVSASKHEETMREVTSSVTVIDTPTIERTVGNNLQALLVEQGFQAYSFGGTNYGNAATSLLYVRGYGQSSMGFSEVNAYTMVLLNGHRINNSALNTLSLVNIERVEVIRGPAAVQYGPSALGGIVNIITRRGDGPVTAKAEVGIGSFKRDDEKASISGSYQGLDFSFGGSHASYGDYTTANGNVYRHSQVDDLSGFDADLGYTFSDTHRIGVHYSYQGLKGEVPGLDEKTMLYAPDSFSAVDDYSYNTTLSYEGATPGGSLSWFANYTFAKSRSESTGYYDANDPNYYVVYYSPYPAEGWYSFDEVDMRQIQAQITYDHPVFSLTPGFDYVEYEGESGDRTGVTSRSKFTDTAAYLLAKIRLLEDKLIITAGGRYDTIELTNYTRSYNRTKFTKSFGVAYSPTDFLKLRAQYAEGFSVPNFTQLFGSGTSYAPSPDLKPQSNQTFEFGADVSLDYFDASLTYFISSFKDKFIAVSTGGTPRARFQNLDGAKLAGLELSLKYDIGRALAQEFSLTPFVSLTWLTEARNKDTNVVVPIAPEALPYTPDLLVSYGITFDYPAAHLSASLNASYFGKSYVQDWYNPDAFNGMTGPWLEHGGFTVVDFNVRKRLLDFGDKGALELKAQVGNLFNTKDGYAYKITIPGRNFQVGLSYEF
ncbi:MAG: TonB-dependent receptor [Deltaproteobacteria bacterium]|jgi:vitamin B12 transporter|nr:TonB-dependent receptor [Deltaproteobacteria bacterium]